MKVMEKLKAAAKSVVTEPDEHGLILAKAGMAFFPPTAVVVSLMLTPSLS